MAILNSKAKLKELQEQNEELKFQLREIYEKKWTKSRLEEVLKHTRNELVEVKEEKARLTLQVNNLNMEIRDHDEARKKLTKEIENLQNRQNEEQKKLADIKSRVILEESKQKEFNSGSIKGKNGKTIEVTDDNAYEDLHTEKIKLEEKLTTLSNRLHLLQEQEKELTEKINEKKKELEKTNSLNNNGIEADPKILEDKIKILKETENKITSEMKKRIAKLKEEEVALQEKIESKIREIGETGYGDVKTTSADLKATEDKLLALVIEDQQLTENIKNKKKSLNDLDSTILNLQEKINELQDNINQLKASEDLKKELISEINDNLSEKEIRLAEVEDQLRLKNDILSEKEIRLAGIEEEFQTKYEKLQDSDVNFSNLSQRMEDKLQEIQKLDDTIAVKTNQLTKISLDLSTLEDKAARFEVEARNFEMRRDDARRQLIQEREENKRLKEESNKLRELLPLLEQRSIEIKSSNESLEIRFSEMLQKLNEEMNQVNKRRSDLEKHILAKENDYAEKQKLFNEKIAALEESERILSLRQTEIDSFETLVKNLTEQTELVKNDLLSLDSKSTEKRNEIGDLQLETELLQKKKSAIEQSLQEVLYSMSNRIKREGDNEIKLSGNIREYENRLTGLNRSIKESMNELIELQTSLSNIKIEHEEHRSGITKLVSMKKKLLADISKHQTILQKYRNANEKLKVEQTMIRKLEEPVEDEIKIPDGSNVSNSRDSGPFLKV